MTLPYNIAKLKTVINPYGYGCIIILVVDITLC